jgi:predicted HicB family RNase H-like nuclease
VRLLAKQAGLTINAYIKDALEEKVEAAVAI